MDLIWLKQKKTSLIWDFCAADYVLSWYLGTYVS